MSDAPVPTRSLHRRPDLPSLTSLRAVAAGAVLLYHLNRWQVTDVLPFGLGYAGVTFFFVLSGFILTWSHVPEQRVRDFYLRRFARVYPSHLLFWLLVVLVPVVAAAPVGADGALESLFLVQAWDVRHVFDANGVAWSLSCEAFFYALFPLLLLVFERLRLLTAVLVAVAAYAVVGSVTVFADRAGAGADQLTVFFTDPLIRLPEFLLGIVLVRFAISGRRARLWWLLPALAFAGAGLMLAKDRPAADVWIAPLVGVGILLVAGLDLEGVVTPLRFRPLLVAGRLSFGFYLAHELVILNAVRLLGAGWTTALVAVSVSIGVAVLVHHVVEVPANRWILRVARRARGSSHPPFIAST